MDGNTFYQWFSKCWPWTNSGELVRDVRSYIPAPDTLNLKLRVGRVGAIYALTSQPGLYDVPWSGEPLFCILCVGWVRVVCTQVHTTIKTQVNIHLIQAFYKQTIPQFLEFGYNSLKTIFNPNLTPPPVFHSLTSGKIIHLEVWMRNRPLLLLPLLCSMQSITASGTCTSEMPPRLHF